ncbi:major capsid hexamer protein [Microbacterium phage Cressida]|uniref:Major capsid protein n=1 Tax=Microbacterium phage Cressida TaxID=2591216 RepID=A0A514DI21_9CAUD|nr:major capsid hexamer protein [Microbacterium phage Cressida]QDH93266.1 major capsid hexamer protein [Microbacterium phage Cressida]
MAPKTPRRFRPTIVSLATAYAEQADETLEIPADLSTLSADELTALSTRAGEAFDALYADGAADLSTDELATLGALTTGIEALAAEQARRDEEAETRRTEAAALAARRGQALGIDANDLTDENGGDDADESDSEDGDDADDADGTDGDADENEDGDDDADGNAVTAAGRQSINLANVRRRTPKQARTPKPKVKTASITDVAFAATGDLGVADGKGITFGDAGKMLEQRLKSFSSTQYANAQGRGQHLREKMPLMRFARQFPQELKASASPDSVEEAMSKATDQSRLPGGSLTAAGWCAPSENFYDLCYNESRDGLLSLPEVQVTRGGMNVPVNPTFAELYSQIGFHFTEEDAIAGRWAPGANPGDPNVVGDKPCYEIECPEWQDYRLEGDGLCITADLLGVRGYPEMLARVTNGALVAHDHKISAGRIARIIAGSTAINMTTDTVGATAPLLAAIEVQVEHYRYAQRLSRSTLLEGVFPYWVHGAIRQDLSVRLGMALFDVTDAMIDGWFRLRGLVPQYVYDWQALDATAAAATLTWPTTVDFLLYQAGTWVAGVDDIITLDTLYDSVMLGQNKFTALFTEEAWLVAKRCVDSRRIRVPLCADGTTHAGVLLDCDLAPTPEPVEA